MKTYKLTTPYGGTETITLEVTQYAKKPHNLAIQAWCEEGPYATLTVNLGKMLESDKAYLDTNNCPWVESFIRRHRLGKPTGDYAYSGFCAYPLYQFNLEKLGVLK